MSQPSITPGTRAARRAQGATRRALLAAAAVLVATALPARPAAAASTVRTIARFVAAAGETPENLAIAPDGALYVSLAYASQVRRILPGGAPARVTLPTRGGIVVGVAIDRRAGALDVDVRSKDARAAGIWQVGLASFGTGDAPRRLAALPAAAFPNGLAFDRAGDLYVADSNLGRIWRIARGARNALPWSVDPLLAPTGALFDRFPVPGANGVHLWRDALYISNTATSTIVRIPIEAGGRAGRAMALVAGVMADDFAFDTRGNLYVAANAWNELLRLDPSGRQTVLATKAADGLDNPSAVAFGVGAERAVLYVTNAAYVSDRPRPSVQRFTVGVPGLALP